MVQKMKSKSFLLAFAILAVFFGYGCKNADVSDELIGIWETSASKYEGCFFEFKEDRIIFGDTEGDVHTYLISNIKKEDVLEEKRTLYEISYKDLQGLEFKFPIYYYPANKGEIRFKNQQEILWSKVE